MFPEGERIEREVAAGGGDDMVAAAVGLRMQCVVARIPGAVFSARMCGEGRRTGLSGTLIVDRARLGGGEVAMAWKKL
jgi:hypothetical protein